MKTSVFPLLVIVVVFAIPAAAAERHMMQPRVPADKLAEARAPEPLIEFSRDNRPG